MQKKSATKWIINRGLVLAIGVGILQASFAKADDLYQLSWHGTVYQQGSNGQVLARSFTEKDFLRQVAQDNGIGDPRLLAFVYRPDKHDTAVVWAANGSFVADIIQMEYQFTEVSNTNQTMTVRQALLFDEYHSNPLGSAFGIERSGRNASGDLISYTFHGTMQYSLPENNAVYSGTFSTRRRIKDTSGQS